MQETVYLILQQQECPSSAKPPSLSPLPVTGTASVGLTDVKLTGVEWKGKKFTAVGNFRGQPFVGHGTASGKTVSGTLRRFALYLFPHAAASHHATCLCPSFCILEKSACLHELLCVTFFSGTVCYTPFPNPTLTSFENRGLECLIF
jgi:hypothetical protein